MDKRQQSCLRMAYFGCSWCALTEYFNFEVAKIGMYLPSCQLKIHCPLGGMEVQDSKVALTVTDILPK